MMDTLTHALVGGTIGYFVAGKENRKKALLWGAGLALLPDLDVFIPYANDLDNMTFHRSWTHSWLVQTMMAPFIALLFHRFFSFLSQRQWWLLIWLTWVTHAGLDALTVYGTQLFWPFMPSPYSGGSIFIIDPTFTIPLLIAITLALIKPDANSTFSWVRTSSVFSAIYLVWGIAAQQWVLHETKQSLAQQHIEYQQIQVSATAFNTFLWRVLVIGTDHYYEGFSSVFDDHEQLSLTEYDRGQSWLNEVSNLASIQRIRWFTNDMFKINKVGDAIIAYDLRMGMEPNYFFQFKIAELQHDLLTASTPNRVRLDQQRKASIHWVWQRIWNPTVQLNTVSALTKE